ncbi:MAG: hypothetical protein HY900_31045 [Deltaproteobacteria bacterium]|nr:hypothetical protein [Deltaproteobacteria bacterium]
MELVPPRLSVSLARLGVDVLLGVAFVVATCAPVRAEGPEASGHTAAGRTTVATDLGGRANPAGIFLRGALATRREGPVDPAAGAASWALEAGSSLTVSPSSAQGGVFAEWTPAPFLLLRAEYDLTAYFGRYGGLLSFPSGSAPFGDRELQKRRGDEEQALGHRAFLQPTLRARLGPFVLRNQTDLAYYRFGGTGPYFLEQEFDTLLKDGDVLLANRTQVLADLTWPAGTGALVAGIGYEVVHARAADLTRRRWSAIGYWEGAEASLLGTRPHAFGELGWNARDRNREGRWFAVLGAGLAYHF